MLGDKKKIVFGQEAKQKLQKGLNILADAVSITLGPKGRNVILERVYNEQRVTKDGVSVARELFLDDSLENIGAQTIKAAASKTADDAGDGTTTATILARYIINEGLKNITAGSNPEDIRKGMNDACKDIIDELKKSSIDIADRKSLIDVATISANNDEEIGEIIADSIYKIGKGGKLLMEDSDTEDTYVEVKEGAVIEHGYISPYFITTSEETILNDPFILVTDNKLNEINQVANIVNISLSKNKDLLIIADEIEKDALHYLINITKTSKIKIIGVRSPGIANMRTFMLEDVCCITGSTLISRRQGHSVKKITSDKYFGGAKKVIIDRKGTTIIEGYGDSKDIEDRKKFVQQQIKNAPGKIKSRHEKRYAMFFGGVATIYIGATTEIEQKEKRDRVEDAICATTLALKEGILPGGGSALLKARKKIKRSYKERSKNIGYNIVIEACTVPAKTIIENSGRSSDILIEKIKMNSSQNAGYDAKKGVLEDDMIKAGIIDPTKVVITALKNAVSVATMLLITEAVIYSIEKEPVNEFI